MADSGETRGSKEEYVTGIHVGQRSDGIASDSTCVDATGHAYSKVCSNCCSPYLNLISTDHWCDIYDQAVDKILQC